MSKQRRVRDKFMGRVVRDKITKLQGTATGRAVFINGCKQILIEPPVYEDANYREIWIDEERLEVVKEEKGVKMTNGPKRGGPNTNPPSRSTGRR